MLLGPVLGSLLGPRQDDLQGKAAIGGLPVQVLGGQPVQIVVQLAKGLFEALFHGLHGLGPNIVHKAVAEGDTALRPYWRLIIA